MPLAWQMDGLELARTEEFHTFPARVFQRRFIWVRIPDAIARALSIKHGDLIQVAIKRLDERDCFEKFRYVPRYDLGGTTSRNCWRWPWSKADFLPVIAKKLSPAERKLARLWLFYHRMPLCPVNGSGWELVE